MQKIEDTENRRFSVDLGLYLKLCVIDNTISVPIWDLIWGTNFENTDQKT